LSAEAPARAPERRPPSDNPWRMLLRPGSLAVHLFAVAATAACVLAGSWQYEAYQNEQAAARADRSGAAPVPVTDVLDPDEPLRNDLVGRRVVVDGTYAPADEQLLVAAREQADRDGWWVLSPVLVERDTALLVVRGWTAEQVLPPVPGGTVTVTAALQPGEDAGARTTPVGDTRVVDTVRLPSLVNVLPYRLYPAYGILTGQVPAPADGLATVSVQAPAPSWSTGGRNLAYALQWWLFAAFALFMWWRVLADRLRPAPPGGRAAAAP